MVAPVAGMRSLVVVMRPVNQTDTADPASLSEYWTPVKHPAARSCRPHDQHGQARGPLALVRPPGPPTARCGQHHDTAPPARPSEPPQSGRPPSVAGTRARPARQAQGPDRAASPLPSGPGGKKSRGPARMGRGLRPCAGRKPAAGEADRRSQAGWKSTAGSAEPCGRGSKPPQPRWAEDHRRVGRTLRPTGARAPGPDAQETEAGRGKSPGPGWREPEARVGGRPGGGVGVEGGLRRNKVTACLMP